MGYSLVSVVVIYFIFPLLLMISVSHFWILSWVCFTYTKASYHLMVCSHAPFLQQSAFWTFHHLHIRLLNPSYRVQWLPEPSPRVPWLPKTVFCKGFSKGNHAPSIYFLVLIKRNTTTFLAKRCGVSPSQFSTAAGWDGPLKSCPFRGCSINTQYLIFLYFGSCGLVIMQSAFSL